MSRDWLTEAAAALSGAADRVEVSEARINKLLDVRAAPVALPDRWTLDRARLPRPVAAKLARREARGLPIPLHARNAHWIELGGSDGLQRLGRHTTDHQLAALRAALPHTAPAAPPAPQTVGRWLVSVVKMEGETTWVAVSQTVVMVIAVLAMAVSLVADEPVRALLVATVWVSVIGVTAGIRHAYRSRTTLSGTDWAALEAATVAQPRPRLGTREYGLAQIAVTLADQITDCPAWSTADLAAHRMQLDPDAEATQVIAHAAEISRIRGTLGSIAEGGSTAAVRAREQRAGDDQVLAVVTDSLTRRVAALYRYAAELDSLNTDHLALQAVERSLAANPALDALVRQTGSDEIAARHVDQLAEDARDIHAGITARLQVLTGDLHALVDLPAGPAE